MVNWHKLKLAVVIPLWLIFATFLAIILYFLSPEKFSDNLDILNKLITLVLAPLALLSAAVSWTQWKEQKDREQGYEDLHPDSGEPSDMFEEEPDDANIDKPVVPGSKQLTIFNTSKQKTILTASPSGLTCRIEDIRPGKGGQQWTLSMDEVNHILSSPEQQISTKPYKSRTGLVSIGKRKNWLYTLGLFDQQDIKTTVKQLLEKCG